jgi:hypothetical protein
VARLLDGEKMAGLCAEFGISRKTGDKIYSRCKGCGIAAPPSLSVCAECAETVARHVRYADGLVLPQWYGSLPDLDERISELKRPVFSTQSALDAAVKEPRRATARLVPPSPSGLRSSAWRFAPRLCWHSP